MTESENNGNGKNRKQVQICVKSVQRSARCLWMVGF